MQKKPTYEELEKRVKELEKIQEQYRLLSTAIPDSVILDDVAQSLTGADLLESLKSSYAVLEAVVESPKDVVIFALDREYQYLAFNRNHHQTMKRIWGVDITIGSSMLDYIKNPDDRLKAKSNFDRALSGESFIIEEQYGDTALERRYYEDIYNPIIDENENIIGLTLFLMDVTERKRVQDALIQEKEKLQEAITKIKQLSGLLPICCHCKKIRDDKGYWNQIETYIRYHSEAEFSHSICPECAKLLYPDIDLYEEP